MALTNESLQSLRIDRSNASRRYQADRSRWIWVGGGVLAVIAIGAWLLLHGKSIEVTTVRVEPVTAAGASGAVLNASGYVVARRIATVSSNVTGRVIDVLIEEGATVEKNQLLARLDPATTAAQVNLSERELDAARRGQDEIRVRLAEAKRNLARTESLRAKALISEGALDTARAEAAALEARLTTQEAQRKVAESGLRLRQRDLADLEIRAPFAGVVISKDAQPGEMVSPISAGGGFTRTGIATIVDMDSREIEVDVNEAFINRVLPAQHVEAVLDAYPDAPMQAHVVNIVPTADRQKATVRVRIGFEKLEPRVLPDMGVKVRFLEDSAATPSAASRIRVPGNALVRDAGNSYVWLLMRDRAERRAVSSGAERDGLVEVTAGVRAGDEVISPVPAGLADGAAVRRKANRR